MGTVGRGLARQQTDAAQAHLITVPRFELQRLLPKGAEHLLQIVRLHRQRCAVDTMHGVLMISLTTGILGPATRPVRCPSSYCIDTSH